MTRERVIFLRDNRMVIVNITNPVLDFVKPPN